MIGPSINARRCLEKSTLWTLWSMLRRTTPRTPIPAREEQNVVFVEQCHQERFPDAQYDDEYATPWHAGNVLLSPVASAFLDAARVAERDPRFAGATRGRQSDAVKSHGVNE
jgi:hypothetical protein